MASVPPDRRWTDPVQAESHFLLVVRRFAGPARGIGLLLVSVLGLLATPAEALPLGYALLGLAVACGVADIHAGSTGRGRTTACVLAVVRAGAVCATQQWTAPVPDELNQWALNTLTITAITLQWEWPPSLTVPALAGLLALSLPTLGSDESVTTVLRAVIESVLARLAFLLLLRSAREVDRSRERRVQQERAESLALARHREEREYLALLHDTASATFLIVASRGVDVDPARVAEYARRDIAILNGSEANDGRVAVESSLRPLVEQSPLEVDVRCEPVPLVPVSVALALVRAVREALLNVERHAGVSAVALRVTSEEGGVVVTVTDTGRGFDPDTVARFRHGIRGSLIARMAAVGGSAVVTSAPGTGTTVRLAWSAPEQVAATVGAREPYLFADRVFPVMRFVLLAVVTLTQAVLCGPRLFGNQDVYHPAWTADLTFVALALVSVVSAVWVLRGKSLPIAVVVPGTAVSLIASAVATAAVPPGLRYSEFDWAVGLVGWYLFLLLADRIVVLVVAICVNAAAGAVQFAVVGLPDQAGISTAALVLLSVTSFQLAVVLVVRALHQGARQAGAMAAERDEIATRQALGEQRVRDHRLRFAGQLGTTLPLLVGLADRTLDPRAPGTQRRILLAATQLRRLFAENDDVPDPLVHELSACIDVAERRGLAVSLAVSGETVPAPTAVRRELTGPVITALSTARSQARVSLLRTAEEVRVAVVADAEVADVTTSGALGVEVTWYAHNEQMRMEARWRSEPARSE